MKTYTILVERPRREIKEVIGTLDELKEYFSYTILTGHSHNPKLNKNPKSIKALVNLLNKCYEIIEASCYNRTYISLKD